MRAILLLTLFLVSLCPQRLQAQEPESSELLWYSRVEPVLDKSCLKCHAGVRQQGGLDLRSLETILRGGARPRDCAR